MARVTFEEVQEIFDTDLKADQITAFISVANLLVTNTCATSTAPTLGTDELKEIERWLAAHFACIRDPISLRAKIGDAEAWHFPAAVTTAWGKGLNLTPYGQMAIAIDRTHRLASLGNQKGSFRAAPREDGSNFTENLTKS